MKEDRTTNILNPRSEITSDTKNIFFVIAEPEGLDALREIYVARYPNDKK